MLISEWFGLCAFGQTIDVTWAVNCIWAANGHAHLIWIDNFTTNQFRLSRCGNRAAPFNQNAFQLLWTHRMRDDSLRTDRLMSISDWRLILVTSAAPSNYERIAHICFHITFSIDLRIIIWRSFKINWQCLTRAQCAETCFFYKCNTKTRITELLSNSIAGISCIKGPFGFEYFL